MKYVVFFAHIFGFCKILEHFGKTSHACLWTLRGSWIILKESENVKVTLFVILHIFNGHSCLGEHRHFRSKNTVKRIFFFSFYSSDFVFYVVETIELKSIHFQLSFIQF